MIFVFQFGYCSILYVSDKEIRPLVSDHSNLTRVFNSLINNEMIYRICGGIWILLMGINQCGIVSIPTIVLGIFGIIGGIALLAGL